MEKRITIKTNIFDRLTVKFGAIALSAALLSAAPFHSAYAAAPALGTSETYAILSGPAVSLTDSTVTGDVGSGLPFSTITQTNSVVNGVVHQGDVSSIAAYTDFLGSYDTLATEPCNVTLTGTLAGQVLAPNVYCFDAAATLTGQLTLDGPANGVWIFKVGNLGTGALTGTDFSVVMAGGGQPCNVYWWVAEGVTMTTSNFQGSILAGMDSTFTGGSLFGRDLTKGAATLTGAAVSSCGSGPILSPARIMVRTMTNTATKAWATGPRIAIQVTRTRVTGAGRMMSLAEHPGTRVVWVATESKTEVAEAPKKSP